MIISDLGVWQTFYQKLMMSVLNQKIQIFENLNPAVTLATSQYFKISLMK